MEDFFKKHMRHLTGKDAVKMIHDKIHCAKHYHAEGKMYESLKAFKEAKEMIDDFISEMES